MASASGGRLQEALDQSMERATPFTRSLFEAARWSGEEVAAFINETRSLTVATVSRGHEPHAAVVIGACLDEAIYFTVAADSALARNLRHSDRIAFTCSDASHAVMGRGTAVHAAHSLDDRLLLQRLAEVSHGGTFTPPGWDGDVYRVSIDRIFAS